MINVIFSFPFLTFTHLRLPLKSPLFVARDWCVISTENKRVAACSTHVRRHEPVYYTE